MSPIEVIQIKQNLISWINQLSDVDTISLLDGIKNSRLNFKSWETLSSEEKKIILQGLKDTENNKIMSSDDFWKKLNNA